MSLSDANEVLQRATREGNWIQWRCAFEDGKPVNDIAKLANSRGHVLVGALGEGVEALLARLPECEGKLDFITGIR